MALVTTIGLYYNTAQACTAKMTPEALETPETGNDSDPPLLHIETSVPEATLLRDVVQHDLRAHPEADAEAVLQAHADNSTNSRVFYALDANQRVVGYLDYTVASDRTEDSTADSVHSEGGYHGMMLVVKHMAVYTQGPDVPGVVSKLIKHTVEVAMEVGALMAVEVYVEAKSQDPCGVFCTKANALIEAGFRACDWRALPTVEPEFFIIWRLSLVPPSST